MSSNEEDKSTSESETTVRPKPFSKAPSVPIQDLDTDKKCDPDSRTSYSSTSSASSSSVDSTSDEENDNSLNQYYRKMQVVTDDIAISEIVEKRLDTVEEVTEPLSSGYFQESIGAECSFPKFSIQEEVYSTSEMEVVNSTKSVKELISMEELENQFKNVVLIDKTREKEEDGREPSLSSTSSSPVPCSSNIYLKKKGGGGSFDGCSFDKMSTSFSSKVDSSYSAPEEKFVSIQSPSDIVPNVLKNQIFKLYPSSDEDEDNSFSKELIYRASDDSEYSVEKHEFENDEKNTSTDNIFVDLEERTDVVNTRVELNFFEKFEPMSPIMDNDSGIDGLSRSDSNKPAAIWNKFNKKLKPKISTSPSNILQINKKQPESSNSTIYILNLQIKELQSKLAQVELEKQKIADEAYHRTMLVQKEATRKIESVHKAQEKQADLVHRLEKKLSEFKRSKEDLEVRLLEVSEVSHKTQTKLDDTKECLMVSEGKVNSLKMQQINERDSYENRNQLLSEKLLNANDLNSHLREQLNELQQQNDTLIENVHNCENHWADLKSQLDDQEKNMENRIKGWISSDNGSIKKEHSDTNLYFSVSNKLTNLKRKCLDLKMESQNDLLKMRNELARESRDLVSSCLQIQSSSKYIVINGESVFVGSSEELYDKVQQLGLERKESETYITQLKDQNSDLTHQIKFLEYKLKEKEDIIRYSCSYNVQNEEFIPLPMESMVKESVVSISQLEDYNAQLEGFLYDIEQLVLDDAEVSVKEQGESPTVCGLHNLNISKVTTFSKSGVIESPLPCVQAALNRRHLQVNELRTRLQSCQDRLVSATKKNHDKSEYIDSTERKLEVERQEYDSLKIKMDELSQEKYKALEKVKSLTMDKISSEKTVERYGQELQDLNNELGTLKELHNENLKKMEIQLERYSQLLASNTVLSSKVDELQIIINELEETNLTQKKIVFEQANTIEGMTQDVKVLKHEKELYLNESNNISKDQKYFESQIINLKKEEKLLKTTISSMEEEKQTLFKNLQEHEEFVEDLRTEKDGLMSENLDKSQQLKSLKESFAECDIKFREIEFENKSLKDQYNHEKLFREKTEKEVFSLRKVKDELDNSLASMILRKDALEDEVSHFQAELSQMKERLSRLSNENFELNKTKSELDVTVEDVVREINSLKEVIRNVQMEKSEIIKCNDSFKKQIEDLRDLIKSLECDKKEFSNKFQLQAEIIRNLKSEMNEETLSMQVIRNSYETKLSEQKNQYENKVQRIKVDHLKALENALNTRKNMESDLKAKLESDYVEKVLLKEDEISLLQKDVQKANEKIKFLKSKIQEDLILAENSKQKVLTMAEQEKSVFSNKSYILEDELHNVTEELEKYKKISAMKSEESRKSLFDIKSEISGLKSQLNEDRARFEEERSLLIQDLKTERELNAKLKEDIQLRVVDVQRSKNALNDLENRLLQLDSSLSMSENKNLMYTQEKVKRDRTISDLQHELELMEKTKSSLQDKLSHSEVEKVEMNKKLKECDQEIIRLRMKEEDLLNELNEAASQYEEHVSSLQKKDTYTSEIDRNFQEINQRYKELENNYKSIADITQEEKSLRHRIENECHSLKKRVSELNNLKSQHEFEISTLEKRLSSDEHSSSHRLKSLRTMLEETSRRERNLEKQRHELELRSNSAEEKINNLEAKICGYDVRIAEMINSISKLESQKKTLCLGVMSIFTLLGAHQGLHLEDLENANAGSETQVIHGKSMELLKSKLEDILANISRLESEKNELKNSVEEWKMRVDHSNFKEKEYKERSSKHKAQIKRLEEQLKKMEEIISRKDFQLATQDDAIQRKDSEINLLKEETYLSKVSLEDLKIRYDTSLIHKVRKHKSLESQQEIEYERRNVVKLNEELQSQLNKLKVINDGLKGDKVRLEMNIAQKESDNKTLKDKIGTLQKELNTSEDTCLSLKSTIRMLKHQLDDQNVLSNKTENNDALVRVGFRDLRSMEIESLINELEKDKENLENKLSDAQLVINQLQTEANRLEKQVIQYKSGNFEMSILEDSSLKSNSDFLKNRLTNIHERINMVTNDNAELRKKQIEHIRPQIPLNIDNNSSLRSECMDHILLIKNLNQKIERQTKKIQGLELQLEELKAIYKLGLEKSLQEFSKDRDKENKRHRDVIYEKSNLFSQKEKNYRDQIHALKMEVHSLTEKLAQEHCRRKSYISNVTGMSNGISELRVTLDQSLDKVASLDVEKDLLEQETSKLNQTADFYSSRRISPFKRSSSNSRACVSPNMKQGISMSDICNCSTPKQTPPRRRRSHSASKRVLHYS